MTIVEHLTATLATLREQRRTYSGPITEQYHQLHGAINATAHALAAATLAEQGKL